MKIVPYTTRPIREGEIDGVTYHFVSDEVHKQMLADGLVVESRSYNTIHGIWTYFTSANSIDLDNNSYMNINTLSGYESFKNYFGEENVVPIYIQVEEGIRLQRALTRERKEQNPKYEELCRRFLADQEDFSVEKLIHSKIDERFNNNDLVECILEIENKITNTLEKENKKRQYQI